MAAPAQRGRRRAPALPGGARVLVDSGRRDGAGRARAEQQLVAVLAGGEVQRRQRRRRRRRAPGSTRAGSEDVMRGWWMRQSSTATGRQLRILLKPSRASAMPAAPGDDVELAAPPVPPRVGGAVDDESLRDGHALAAQRVAHDVRLEVELVRVARRAGAGSRRTRRSTGTVPRTRCADGVRDGDGVREPHPPLAVLQLHLDALTGERAVDEQRWCRRRGRTRQSAPCTIAPVTTVKRSPRRWRGGATRRRRDVSRRVAHAAGWSRGARRRGRASPS